ncbi:MAG: hypothetical protein BWK76_19150 [Desulfobulbaceae bacterium A2]|nr:MAG: hypothetical protein BWK76_19150 [Desulfobulbaceae bacterium A2]
MNNSLRRVLLGLLPVLCNRYALLFLFLVFFTSGMALQGGLPSLLPAWRFEIPLLLYAYWYLNRITRTTPWQPIVAALPVVLIYGGLDAYHIMFGRLPRIAEVSQIGELFEVLQTPGRIVAIVLVCLPVLGLMANLDLRRKQSMAFGLLPFLLLALPMQFLPGTFMRVFEVTQRHIFFYSDILSVELNGRISMILYNQAKKQASLKKLADFQGNVQAAQAFTAMTEAVQAQDRKRNVHLIVLESFMDPTLMEKAEFSRSPIHQNFEKIFKGKRNFTVSPVFGGGTAQAEFEVLCGVPAMRELSGVEFDVFTGSRTACLPNILNQGGYQTIATNSYKPDFFNAANAMAGVGFEKTYFPQEYAGSRETYFSTGDIQVEGYMFDSDLLTQNLKFIERKIQEQPDRPLFNYVLTMYGHTPHLIDTDKRPAVVELLGNHRDDELERYLNQYYYRTEAVATYVTELMRIDPQSLIILVSDHVPPLRFGPLTYKELGYLGSGGEEDSSGMNSLYYLNQVFFIENGRTVQHGTIRHFDIPRIVLDYVTEGRFCRDHACGFATRQGGPGTEGYLDEYMVVMSQAMNPGTASADLATLAGMDSPVELRQNKNNETLSIH